jgi:hypothetical protein
MADYNDVDVRAFVRECYTSEYKRMMEKTISATCNYKVDDDASFKLMKHINRKFLIMSGRMAKRIQKNLDDILAIAVNENVINHYKRIKDTLGKKTFTWIYMEYHDIMYARERMYRDMA